jgi:hypothetical protein
MLPGFPNVRAGWNSNAASSREVVPLSVMSWQSALKKSSAFRSNCAPQAIVIAAAHSASQPLRKLLFAGIKVA